MDNDNKNNNIPSITDPMITITASLTATTTTRITTTKT